MLTPPISLSFDIHEPILPGVSLAGVRVGQHLSEIYHDLKYLVYGNEGNFWLEDPFYIRYEMRGVFSVVVHALNGKVIKVGALQGYAGEMASGIRVGMSLASAKELDPGLEYDDFEECYHIDRMPGVAIEVSDEEDQRIQAITVFLPALNGGWDRAKELGRW